MLNRDPLSGRLMARLAPRVCQWVERLRHPQPQAEGSFVGGDEVPDTLLPILKAAFSERQSKGRTFGLSEVDRKWPAVNDRRGELAVLTRPVARHSVAIEWQPRRLDSFLLRPPESILP